MAEATIAVVLLRLLVADVLTRPLSSRYAGEPAI